MSDGRSDLRRRVEAMYTSSAEVYERLWAPALEPVGRELIRDLPLAGARRVLDAGCGVGALYRALREAAPGATVVGVDLSMGMLRRAPEALPRAAMDLSRLGLADGVFDVAVAPFVLFHVDEPRRAVAELRRTLRAGGVLGALTWGGEPDFPAQRVWIEELDRLGAAPTEPMTRHGDLCTTERMRALLEAEGFEQVACRERVFGFAHDIEAFLALRTGFGASGERYRSLETTAREVLLRRVRARLEALPPRAFVDASRVILTRARGTRAPERGTYGPRRTEDADPDRVPAGSTSVRLVPARDDHRDFVGRLSAEVFARFGDYRTMLPAMMRLPWTRTVIAEVGGAASGFAIYSLEDLPLLGEIDLAAIAVEPGRQSRGVGRALLAHVERQAARLAPPDRPAAVRLTVAEDNERARRLFSRAGFSPVPGAPGLYPGGQRSLTLRKEIRRPELDLPPSRPKLD